MRTRWVWPSSAVAVAVAVLAVAACSAAKPVATPPPATSGPAVKWGMVLHGGAGTISRDKLTPEREAELRAKLSEALRAGHAVLQKGGSSLDAVSAALVVLEDSPLFNAGKGAVFTHDGRNELDAALMDGRTLKAGAVGGVHRVKNPILLARAVMERSPHVMMVGDGAEQFAQTAGIELVDPKYFFTQERWDGLQKELERERAADGGTSLLPPGAVDGKFGTVGAVALDQEGGLAAGTSTGGMTNKRYGRIGDSPIIGAGTYANGQCGISATGHGEFFIRYTVAHDICARMAYRNEPLQQAADEVVMQELKSVGGEGGVIAMDAQGHIAMPFNTSGMYRGFIGPDGEPHVSIFAD